MITVHPAKEDLIARNEAIEVAARAKHYALLKARRANNVRQAGEVLKFSFEYIIDFQLSGFFRLSFLSSVQPIGVTALFTI